MYSVQCTMYFTYMHFKVDLRSAAEQCLTRIERYEICRMRVVYHIYIKMYLITTASESVKTLNINKIITLSLITKYTGAG